jgi:hypothetical protein
MFAAPIVCLSAQFSGPRRGALKGLIPGRGKHHCGTDNSK